MSFFTSLPRVGAMALKPRDAGVSDKDQQDILNPASKEYRALATDAADYQVGMCGNSIGWCRQHSQSGTTQGGLQ